MYNINYNNVYEQKNIRKTKKKNILISDMLNEILYEIKFEGVSERTMRDYEYHFNRLCTVANIRYIDELTKTALIKYLQYNDVKDSTKKIRLKNVRAILNRMHFKGYIPNFWHNIQIKVPVVVKEGISENELHTLLSLLDFTNFSEFRDACIFLLIYETGFRIGTVGELTTDMLDLSEGLVSAPGNIMKNYQALTLPISKELSEMLTELLRVNKQVLRDTNKNNDFVFISVYGNSLKGKGYVNTFSKRVNDYKKRFGLEHINPHAIRRGFAKRLLDKGVNIAIISKALNHKSIETTTRYLYIDNQEIIDTLREI